MRMVKWLKWEDAKEWGEITCPMLEWKSIMTYYTPEEEGNVTCTAPFLVEGGFVFCFVFNHDRNEWEKTISMIAEDYLEFMKFYIYPRNIPEMPWSMEDTVENLRTIKEIMHNKVVQTNLHGRAAEDAEEVDFDFDRAIEALEKQIPREVVREKGPCYAMDVNGNKSHIIKMKCPRCGNPELVALYPCRCGQMLDWSFVLPQPKEENR